MEVLFHFHKKTLNVVDHSAIFHTNDKYKKYTI